MIMSSRQSELQYYKEKRHQKINRAMTYVFHLISNIPPKSYRILAWMWLILTLTLSLLSRGTMASLNIWDMVGIDKLGHMGFYAILSFLWFMALRNKANQTVKIILSIVCFGVLMEYCQFYFTNGRAFEWLDALANSAGTIFGYILFVIVTKYQKTI
jgi:VanZ family protein